MRAKSVSDFRKNIASDIDRVVEDHVPLIITRNGGKPPVVVMSLEDFSSWQETQHLLRSPANRERLLKAVKDADEGKAVARQLME